MQHNLNLLELDYVQLLSFLERSVGSPKMAEIAKECMNYYESIIGILEMIYPSFAGKPYINNHVIRIIKIAATRKPL